MSDKLLLSAKIYKNNLVQLSPHKTFMSISVLVNVLVSLEVMVQAKPPL